MDIATLYFTLFMSICICIKGDPCVSTVYTELDEWHRSVGNSDVSSRCDSSLKAGWYRITSGAGEEMPTECIQGGLRCGTVYPLWMNDTFPVAGETKNVQACASSFSGDCCMTSYDIQVKNCSGYYVYNLVPTYGCPQGYCFGFELPCPVGETSPTGFTPGCRYEPCLQSNYKTLTEWQRSVNNQDTTSALCDNNLAPGWYRATSKAGERMPNQCVSGGQRCGTTNSIWLNGTFPAVDETTNLTACTASPDGDCCKNNYDIQVKNCSDYLIYNLAAARSCPEAYCFGSEIPCKDDEISDNGFSPGCKVNVCHVNNYKILENQERRSSNYTLKPGDSPLDDSNLTESFYRIISTTGNDMANTAQPMYQCGTHYPIYMEGEIPGVNDDIVSRKLCLSGTYNICQIQMQVQIKNCGGDFRVYRLNPSPLQNSSYCFGNLPVREEDPEKDKDQAKDSASYVPWIVSVTVLGMLSVVLGTFLLVRKFKAKLPKVKPSVEQTMKFSKNQTPITDVNPPPYSSIEISPPPYTTKS